MKLHPRQIEYRERMRQTVVGVKVRRGPVGCYECCRQRGSRSDLWDRLCTVCHKVTRGQSCCGYMTVTINPRIRVPRVGSGRWKAFLRKYPQFVFRESLRLKPTHTWTTSPIDYHKGNVWFCEDCERVVCTVDENFMDLDDDICLVRKARIEANGNKNHKRDASGRS